MNGLYSVSMNINSKRKRAQQIGEKPTPAEQALWVGKAHRKMEIEEEIDTRPQRIEETAVEICAALSKTESQDGWMKIVRHILRKSRL